MIFTFNRKLAAGLCALGVFLSPAARMNIPSAAAAVEALWPVEEEYQEITTYFDPNRNIFNSGHNAIDIPAGYGTNIYASLDGECVSAGYMNDYGYLIILWHEAQGIYTFYAHCSGLNVSAGQTVSSGDVIGYVGSTGTSTGNHVHFGICDTLINGWPDITYYDPLTYFTFSYADVPEIPECSCSEEYAGIYTTKDVDTYLNIRSGHGSEYKVVGKLYPDSEFVVTKADSEWAHVEYNGISGFCSTEYIQKAEEKISGIELNDTGTLNNLMLEGELFRVKGIIKSGFPLKSVTGGIYEADGETPIYTAEANPDSNYYNIKSFDNVLLFNRLKSGSYVYRLTAEDSEGYTCCLVEQDFMVCNAEQLGDVNRDDNVTIADMLMIQSFVLGKKELNSEQLAFADLNRDGGVDAFDMVLMRRKLIHN
ncbi:MAG: peptidoglycan DD-metalloendopeptidase family protein [Ruminococcus sp.]|nr:peptidoglycan DD-metalloendopeptidase family protein [Ruminococcus sp.]MDE6784763.1 peptidoglycan DD-metalloendopeptidase family protein [Ruminococcus sp.]